MAGCCYTQRAIQATNTPVISKWAKIKFFIRITLEYSHVEMKRSSVDFAQNNIALRLWRRWQPTSSRSHFYFSSFRLQFNKKQRVELTANSVLFGRKLILMRAVTINVEQRRTAFACETILFLNVVRRRARNLLFYMEQFEAFFVHFFSGRTCFIKYITNK